MWYPLAVAGRVVAHDGEFVGAPFPESNFTVAVLCDQEGNVLGLRQAAPEDEA